MVAAIPNYLQKHLQSQNEVNASLSFSMYLDVWDSNWKIGDKNTALKQVKNKNEQKLVSALKARQDASFLPYKESGNGLCVKAKSTAPFTTGLGYEHPLENGFAFLNPYGVPYLAGSSVKGVLRCAARELCSLEWEDESASEAPALEWQEDYINGLFGTGSGSTGRSDSSTPAVSLKNEQRGALQFWDVIPDVKGNPLLIEVMTPHQSAYYEGKEDPHDSGQPVLILFLTAPPRSKFEFYVAVDPKYLQSTRFPELQEGWKELMQQAFDYACEWLGFGAKTAVGYGAMRTENMRYKKAIWYENVRIRFLKHNNSIFLDVPQLNPALAVNQQTTKNLLEKLDPQVTAKIQRNDFMRFRARIDGEQVFKLEIMKK